MTRTTDYLAVTYEDIGSMWTAELALDNGADGPAVAGSTKAEAGRLVLEPYIRSLNNHQQETD